MNPILEEEDPFLLLEREVRDKTREISDKYVANPSIDEILSDVIIGLKRFKRSIRLQWKRLEEKRLMRGNDCEEESEESFEESEEEESINSDEWSFDEDGLGTNLRPGIGAGFDMGPRASREIENFLIEVESVMINHVLKCKEDDKRKVNKTDRKIRCLMNRLKKDDSVVVVPTDNTNRYVLVKTEDHNRWMEKNLADEGAIEISHTRLKEIFTQALQL